MFKNGFWKFRRSNKNWNGITIPKNLYALFFELKIYNDFVLGAYDFEIYNLTLTSSFRKTFKVEGPFFTKTTQDSRKGCYNTNYFINSMSDYSFDCVSDKKDNNDSIKCSKSYCVNVCFETNNSYSSSCLNKNGNFQYLFKELIIQFNVKKWNL